MKQSITSRRKFLQQGGLSAAGIFALNIPSWATYLMAPLTIEQAVSRIGSEKKLDPEWVRSLYLRGSVTTYLKSKNELQYIGMPVGGINAGSLYLGGDGRLWLWDIFNLNQEGINPLAVPWGNEMHDGNKVRSRDGSAYIAPARSTEIRPLEQGFAIQLEYEGKTVTRHLMEEDWPDISFEATYPMATIRYMDPSLPVEISMQAYSPFIPLDELNSGLPATVFSIHVKNKGQHPVKVSLSGWLENKAAMHTAEQAKMQRNNSVKKGEHTAGIFSTLDTTMGKRETILNNFDYGSLCIAALTENVQLGTDMKNIKGDAVFQVNPTNTVTKSAKQTLIGNIVDTRIINTNQQSDFHYVISWHTPNLMIGNGKVLPEADRGRYYDNQFKNAFEVAEYIGKNFETLSKHTRLWQETWYDSTLPYWFLDRSFLNISSLATTTSHRFKSGRYWAWEGVGACEGNCAHVWQYAQAPGRLFPAMERDNRERVDLGISLQEDGGIWFRGEYDKRPAIDGQAGRILGVYREHQMSVDSDFLGRNWNNTKKATQYIINQDRNKDGMQDTPLENTLDAIWDGEIAWIVGLCLAAVQSAELMAIEMNDIPFAKACKEYVQKGKKNMEEKLFNGEYFIHRPDQEKGRKKLGSYNTSHIDQVFGQSWAFQVGLPRVLDKRKTVSALNALWKYNFMTDVGPYIQEHTGGRPYALAGEGGMIMNTNPKNEARPYGENVTWQMGYFHECMSGFEHQVASHMMAEGMTDEALVLTRVIHDRYHAAKRNPFNEIECSDHYARAMASYGTFITACGFEYHGPKRYIKFSPLWNKSNFKAAFTAAEGWGTYTQNVTDKKQEHQLEIKYGSLQLTTLVFEKITPRKTKTVSVYLDNQRLPATFSQEETSMKVVLKSSAKINAAQKLNVIIQ